MKIKTISAIALALVAGSALVSSARAEEDSLSATLDVPFLSSYVWRGQVLNDEPVLEPSLTVAKGGLSLNVWSNYDLTDNNDNSGAFSEIDLTASYTESLDALSLTGGVVNYTFPNTDTDASSELFATVSFSDLPVTPSVSVYWDFDEAQGFYASAGLSYLTDIQEGLTAGASTTLGWATDNYNSFYFARGNEAWNDLNIGAYVTVTLSDAVTLTPAVQYTALVSDTIRDRAEEIYDHKDMLVGSLKLTYKF